MESTESQGMRRFTGSVAQALKEKNWYAALYLSLTLPDICARLESKDEKTDSTKYIDWYDRYLLHKYAMPVGNLERHVFLSGRDCYALRCAILHEGSPDISAQKRREALNKFHFTVVGAHCNQIGNILQLDVPRFCEDICTAVDAWRIDFCRSDPTAADKLSTLVEIHVGSHGLNL